MLNKRTYKAVEFTDDDDMVVGMIWKDGSKFVDAEIIDNCITNSTDLDSVREFLDEVDAFVNEVVSK